jgi:dephospho-CoA kinase
MLKVGITGNMGSGKSTVAAIFAQLGVPVYNADAWAKWLMVNDTDLVNSIKNLFGSNAYLDDGTLNRTYIGSVVFKNKHLLEQLNSLVHPKVFEHFNNWVSNQTSDSPFILKEAALLIESKSYLELDKLIVVVADEELLIKRVMERDRLSSEEVTNRLKNQMSQSEKIKLAHYIIENNNLNPLLPQVLHVFNKLCKQKS